MIVRAGLLPEQQMAAILDEANQLCNIVGKSVVTARNDKDKDDENMNGGADA